MPKARAVGGARPGTSGRAPGTNRRRRTRRRGAAPRDLERAYTSRNVRPLDGPEHDLGRSGDSAPFFVVGADRSGTTLLRLYLNAHSALAVPNESWFLIDLFRAFSPTAALSSNDVVRAIEIVTSHPRYVDGWSVAASELRTRLEANGIVTTAEFIDTLYRLQTHDRPGTRWGDKTPEYVAHVDDLHRCFPRAQFVHIVRDGRDVYLSLEKRRWSDRGWTPYEVGRYWSRAVRNAASGEARLGAARFLTVRYEDLVVDTRGTLKRVCAFLAITFEPGMLEAHSHADAIQTPREREKQVHDRLGRAPRNTDVERWRSEGASWRRALVESMIAPELRRYGYPEAPAAWRSLALRPVAFGHYAWTRRGRPFLRRVLRGVKWRLPYR